MADLVTIYLGDADGSGWSKSTGWTSMSLSRSKDNLTGQLRVDYFFGYVPETPVLVDLAYGREILVYIDGWLAFTGIIDTRRGKGSNTENSESETSISIGPNDYTVTINARGKTKTLIDSSHDIRTNMNGFNTQEVVDRLVAPWGIEVQWEAEPQALNVCRFRDGSRVIDELGRVALENSHYIYEARDGSLVVSDGAGTVYGDALVLGKNILNFNANQSEGQAKSRIRVKGQRSDTKSWGVDAVLPTVLEIEIDALLPGNDRPVVVQHYGDATPETLERRAYYEANKRAQLSKNVTIDLFSVTSDTGVPWDIGLLHRVKIPPEGIDQVMECTSVAYRCDAQGSVQTTLELAPAPNAVKKADRGLLGYLPEEGLDENFRSVGITYAGNYPAPWEAGEFNITDIPVIGDIVEALGAFARGIFSPLEALDPDGKGKPPERID